MPEQHYRVEALIMERVLNTLAQLPYCQVAGLIADLQAKSSGPHVGPVNEPQLTQSEGSHEDEPVNSQ